MAKGGASTSVAELKTETLKRELGIGGLFSIGYGDLGSSIYYALGLTALYAMGATPIALAMAGFIFVCTALTYAELTSMFHEAGGSASFCRHAFNDLVSFIAGWGILLDYIVTIAISAFSIPPYLAYFLPILKIPEVQIGFAVGIISVLFILNFIGIKQSAMVSIVLVIVTIVTQLAIIIVGGGFKLDLRDIIAHMKINVAGASWSPSWPEFWKGVGMAMVAYTGIESISQLGAEAKKPKINLPRAIVLVMWILLAMYLGLSVVGLSVLSPKELGTTYIDDPVAGIVGALPFGGGVLGPWIGLLAPMLLFVAANAGMVGSSRLSFNLGQHYQMPRTFYRLHQKFRTPWVSLAFFAILASLVVILSTGKLSALADLYNFGAMIAFFSAHISLIVMRIKRPSLARPFYLLCNIPIGKYRIPLTAVIGALGTFSVWCLVVITKPHGRYLGFAWILAGTLMYFYYRRKRGIAPAGQISIEKVSIPGYKLLAIKNILVATRGGDRTDTVQFACELAKLHNAKLTAITFIEIAASIPLDAELSQRVSHVDAILKRAEAIARESNLDIELKMLRTRSIVDGIITTLKEGHYDLLVIGAPADGTHGVGSVVERVLKRAQWCRVCICSHKR